MIIDKGRVCVTCKHWSLDLGTPDWSDVTPGDRAQLSCFKGHYSFFMGDGYHDAYVKAIESAESCADYEKRDLHR